MTAKDNKRSKNWAAAHPERRKEHHKRSWLRRKYGLTLEEHAELLDSQGGKCVICRTDTPRGQWGWNVDHDHETGAVRGLLCHSCNIGLGHFKDQADLLQSAADYLREHGEQSALV